MDPLLPCPLRPLSSVRFVPSAFLLLLPKLRWGKKSRSRNLVPGALLPAPGRPPTPESPGPLRGVKILSLEGLIGSGKSTQMQLLKERYKGDPRVVFVDEPVDDWNQLGLLEAMYNGQVDPGMFQLMALMSRIAPIQRALHSSAELIITERSPWSDYFVFARANLTGISLDTYAYTFSQIQKTLEDLVRIEATFVYLECDVDMAMARLKKRARSAEAGVPLAYMDLLRTKHEAMVLSLIHI